MYKMTTNNSTNTPELTLNGQTFIGSTGLDPVAATLTAGGGITITNGAGTITISTASGGSAWVDQTTTPITIGDFVEINGKGVGLYTIAQATGQQIHFGNIASTLGAGGSVSSILEYDCIRLRCLTANTIWVVVSSVGNFTIV